MPISVGVHGGLGNIVDIVVGEAGGVRPIGWAYVGDASNQPRLVWQKRRPVSASFSVNFSGLGLVGESVTLTASSVTGGSGHYLYTFKMNGTVIRTVPSTTATSYSVQYVCNYAGSYTASVTITDANDATNTFYAEYAFFIITNISISVSASPSEVLLGNNIEFSWVVSNGSPPYSNEIQVYRNNSLIKTAGDIGNPWYLGTDNGFGEYSAYVTVTDSWGLSAGGWSNSVSVYAFGYTSGSNVNVRSGPGMEYSSVGQISATGSQVAVYDYVSGWYYISYGSIRGYISSSYLVVP